MPERTVIFEPQQALHLPGHKSRDPRDVTGHHTTGEAEAAVARRLHRVAVGEQQRQAEKAEDASERHAGMFLAFITRRSKAQNRRCAASGKGYG
jgi:hypothetical protein